MTTSNPILLCHALAVALAIMLGAIAAGHAALADVSLAGVATVIDGDTLEIHGTRIRLHGIDAPESDLLPSDAAGMMVMIDRLKEGRDGAEEVFP